MAKKRKKEEEIEVNDMSASLVLGQRCQLWFSRTPLWWFESGRTKVRPFPFLSCP